VTKTLKNFRGVPDVPPQVMISGVASCFVVPCGTEKSEETSAKKQLGLVDLK